MKHGIALSGLVGILLALGLYGSASVLSTIIPILLQGNLFVAIAFTFCLALSLVEIPIMIFGLRQMAHSATTPRRLVTVTFGFYVMFAAVYASIFVVLTGQVLWGSVLVALTVVRMATGVALR